MSHRPLRHAVPLVVAFALLGLGRQTLLWLDAARDADVRLASPIVAFDAVVQAKDDRPVARIAYCVTRWNMTNFTESDSSPWIARRYGEHIFPPAHYRLELSECVARPADLREGVDPLSREGRAALGLDAHVRFCHKGSSTIVKLLVAAGLGRVDSVPRAQVEARLRAAGLWTTDAAATVKPLGDGWRGLVYWPQAVSLVVDTRTGQPLAPLMFRHNFEPYGESVEGVAGQLDSKTVDLSTKSATVFYPFALFSMAFRMSDERSLYARHIGNALGSNVTRLEDIVQRPAGFDAAAERARKLGFAASINTNCAGRSTIYPGVIVRELFSYALANVTAKPVHNVGQCPYFELGRSLFPVSERWAVKARYKHSTAVEVFHDYKFAMVFENSGHAGGVTEKPFTAYLGRAIPVYNGPEDLLGLLNEDAIVNCALPASLTAYQAILHMKKAVCAALPPLAKQCAPEESASRCDKSHSTAVRERCSDAFHAHIEPLVWPYLKRCALRVKQVDEDDALYDKMLAAPMVSRLEGVWDAATVGGAMREVFMGAGYVVD